MNGFPGLEALHDLIAETLMDVETIIPDDLGTADLFLRDHKALRLMGTQRVRLNRNGHEMNLLVILVGYPCEMGRVKDPDIPETDNLQDANYVVLSREATALECAAWTSDVPPAEVPLRALEVLRIAWVTPGTIFFRETQRIHRYVSHY